MEKCLSFILRIQEDQRKIVVYLNMGFDMLKIMDGGP
jgi:hypothetical protein